MMRLRRSRLAAEVADLRAEIARANARLDGYDTGWTVLSLPAAVGDDPRLARADRIAASGLTLIPGGKS